MGTKNLSKTTAQALDLKAIEGVDKYLGSVTQVSLSGTTYTPTALKAVLQGEIDADKAVDLARAQYKQQVVSAKGARAKARALRNALRSYVLSTFGADAVQTLEGFGFAVPKPRGPKTAKAKAEGTAAALATRHAKKEAIANVAHAPSTPAPAAPPAASGTPSKS
jgi:regulator of protease activity HflC (stomatin/prohibitin superfamily)